MAYQYRAAGYRQRRELQLFPPLAGFIAKEFRTRKRPEAIVRAAEKRGYVVENVLAQTEAHGDHAEVCRLLVERFGVKPHVLRQL